MLHTSLSKLNGTWAWLWFEWNIPHILMHSNTWFPVGGWWGGLGRVTMLEEVRHWGRLWGLVYWDVCTLLLLQLTQCCSWHAFHNDGLLHLLSSINCLSHVFLLKWPVWYSYWQPCRLSQWNVSTLLMARPRAAPASKKSLGAQAEEESIFKGKNHKDHNLHQNWIRIRVTLNVHCWQRIEITSDTAGQLHLI